MRILIALLLLAACTAAADEYIYARAGKAVSAPRELPSVGVRLDTGKAVLGLHGAGAAVQAACGWFRVIPATPTLGVNQYIASRSYAIGKDTAQEVVTIATAVPDTRTPAERIGEVLDSIATGSDDERVTAIVRAVATAVTNRVSKAVTVTIPAAKLSVQEAAVR